MSTYQALLSGLFFGAGALAACRFTALHYQSRLSEATASAARFKAWWERDSGKMLIAQAQLDLIHQQHVDAGRKAHAPFKALRAETTEKLMQCVANRETSPLDVDQSRSTNSPARQDQPPAAPLSSCRGSAARSKDRIGGASARSGRQDVGPSQNRRGQSLSAETPTMMKGL